MMTLPAVTILRGAFPKALISYVVEEPYLEIVEGFPAIDQVFSLPRSMGKGEFVRFIKQIRRARYDVLLDFHGGPRSYEWLNTSPIPRIWEQMHLAYHHGADQLWVVNVGDIKPMEFPIPFFMDFAWNPEELPAECLPEYTRHWAEQQFGPQYVEEIADILTKYTNYNGRRKPESLAPDTYSLTNYREAETVVNDYNNIAEKAEKIYKEISSEYKDAYYQLVLYPTVACANLNELYLTLGKNQHYTKHPLSK